MPDVQHWSDERLRARCGEVKAGRRALIDEAKAITGSIRNAKGLSADEGKRALRLLGQVEALDEEHKHIHAEKDRRKNLSPINPNAEKNWMSMDEAEQVFSRGGLFAPARNTITGGKAADSRWSSKALSDMAKGDPLRGLAKSLANAGSVLVPTAFDTTITREGERPTLVRQLLPSQVITGTDRFGFMRQVVRENNAAPVAKGALKPTSRYKVERVEDRARVIAHLSEPIDRVDLEDAADLANFLDSEMRYGVLSAGEDQILNGDGQGENLTGILATPGILAQEYSSDPLTTLRKALTVQQALSNSPTAWVLSPSDWEALELTRENGTSGPFMLASGPVDRAAQRLWGLPVVVSAAMSIGQAVLGDFAGSARVYQREDVQISWSDGVFLPDGAGGGSIGFQRNQLTMRAEERMGLAVTRPSAFVDIALAAA